MLRIQQYGRTNRVLHFETTGLCAPSRARPPWWRGFELLQRFPFSVLINAILHHPFHDRVRTTSKTALMTPKIAILDLIRIVREPSQKSFRRRLEVFFDQNRPLPGQGAPQSSGLYIFQKHRKFAQIRITQDFG